MNTYRVALVSIVAIASAACTTVNKPETPAAAAVPAAPAVANIAGDWRLVVQSPVGPIPSDMNVAQNGRDFTGKIKSQMGNVDCKGTIDGTQVKFSYDVGQTGAPAGTIFNYSGTLEGNEMKGDATFASFGEGTWIATRVK